MNILYIHGLNGSLTPEKRAVLEPYGQVFAPALVYQNDPDTIQYVADTFKNSDIDIIIGSSMGGFASFYLSRMLQVPALLFNPALAERSVLQNIPDTPDSNNSFLKIVLGAQDATVNPKQTLTFLANSFHQPQHYTISIRHDLQHRIPLAVFTEEVTLFFDQIGVKRSSKTRLFLDDLRTVDIVYPKTFSDQFDIVRNYQDFVAYITKNGLPDFISFDNDLGLDDENNIAPDGLAAAKWLVYESGLDLKDLEFHVHSANPVATEQIRGLLTNYIKFINKQENPNSEISN